MHASHPPLRVLPLLLLLSLPCPSALSSPLSPSDVFSPACSPAPTVPAPPQSDKVWVRWSSPSTWPARIIPGVGSAAGANATIPCGVSILLDVPSVDLTLLTILGSLRVLDSPSLPLIQLNASFILVQGVLAIGTPLQHFSQQADITLTPNPNYRTPLLFSSAPPADPANPRILGHKALAVVGGVLDLHGMPGGANGVAWCRLATTAQAGSTTLLLSTPVPDWQPGMTLALASTDYDPRQAENFTITQSSAATAGSGAAWSLTLDQPLQYMHYSADVADGFGGTIPERAEVALLSRSIRVAGEEEGAAYPGEGGHAVVFFTELPQFVEGVEFVNMGQAGIESRFALLYQFHGNQTQGAASSSICRKNAFHHCLHRCVVLQATSGMAVEDNVAYDTQGHCFMTMDGAEVFNNFSRNLGFLTKTVPNPLPYFDEGNNVATFMFANPLNNFIANVAAGSMGLGVWVYLSVAVRGLSALRDDLNAWIPFFTAWGDFRDNVLHSSFHGAFTAWPQGAYPRIAGPIRPLFPDSPLSVQWLAPIKMAYIRNFTIYKHAQVSVMFDTADGMTVQGCSFADNRVAVYCAEISNFVANASRFVALSDNYGTPGDCSTALGWDCAPISGCTLPVASNALGRSAGYNPWPYPTFGAMIDQRNHSEPGWSFPFFLNSSFYKYDPTCQVAAAFAPGLSPYQKDYFNAGTRTKGLKLSKSSLAWFAPEPYSFGFANMSLGPPGYWLAMRDMDGAALGTPGTGGSFITARNPIMLPPPPPKGLTKAAYASWPKCKPVPAWLGFSCPGVCHRTVAILFLEPDWTPVHNYGAGRQNKRGDYSYLMIRRVEDGVTVYTDGNLNAGWINPAESQHLRVFYANLPSRFTYELTFLRNTSLATPGAALTSFAPDNLTVKYQDGSPCYGGMALRFMAFSQTFYLPDTSSSVTIAPCTGAKPAPAQSATYTLNCTNSVPYTALTLGPAFPSDTGILLKAKYTFLPPCDSIPFKALLSCSVLPLGSVWAYNVTDADLHAQYLLGPAFYNPIYPNASSWNQGPALFGYFNNWNNSAIRTWLPQSTARTMAYYFRTTFTLSAVPNYASLLLDIWVDDGVVVYLNNVEVMRYNMPSGPLTSQTPALKDLQPFGAYPNNPYTRLTVDAGAAREGLNYIAVEVHVFYQESWEVGFDLAISASPVLQAKVGAGGGSHTPAEICDGLDNNGDGLVDMLVRGKLLTTPCSTACSKGVRTCRSGAYQACSARPVLPEICNGVDDNCDGIIDNGVGQLNCGPGTVCYQGACRPLTTVLAPSSLPVIPRQSSGWFYFDQSRDLGELAADWKKGAVAQSLLKLGTAPLGFNYYYPSDSFGTKISTIAGSNYTYYFLKNFTLSQSALNETWSLSLSVQRADGAVIYVNGVELFRTNMPAGPITYSTTASGVAYHDLAASCNKFSFYPCSACPSLPLFPFLKAGVNWITVEVHASYVWEGSIAFDAEVARNTLQPCPAPPSSAFSNPNFKKGPSCVHGSTGTTLLCISNGWAYKSNGLPCPLTTWRFLPPANSPPPDNWTKPNFADSSWSSGPAPLGVVTPWASINTPVSSALTSSSPLGYYFRTSFTLPDGACYYNFTANLRAVDGAVVYVNGAEAFRVRVPSGPLTPFTPASSGGYQSYVSSVFSGAYLKNGLNVIAVEVHMFDTTRPLTFDMGIDGDREAVACKPLPTS